MRQFVNCLTVEICRYLVLYCVFLLYWIVCLSFGTIFWFWDWLFCSVSYCSQFGKEFQELLYVCNLFWICMGKSNLWPAPNASFLVFWQAVFFCDFVVFSISLHRGSNCCTTRPVTERNSLGFLLVWCNWTWNQLVTSQLWILLLENVVLKLC